MKTPILYSTPRTNNPSESCAVNLERALDSLCRRASLAIKSGYTLLILSDRGVDEEYAPIPSLLALTAVHNHLVGEEPRAFFVHFWGDGVPLTLARGLKAAIDSAQ